MLRILSSTKSRSGGNILLLRNSESGRDSLHCVPANSEVRSSGASWQRWLTVHLREFMKLSSITAIAALLYASGVSAEEVDVADAPMFTFNAFGTFGVAHSSEDQADLRTGLRAEGAGFTDEWSSAVDSLIAGQVNANFTPKLSAVLQIVLEPNHEGNYDPHVEWANIKYQFTPDFSVRIGRTVLAVFQLSETRKVGFTYPWVRPPLELYQLNPVTINDGVDASYRLHFGQWTHTPQLRVGHSKTKLPQNGGTADATDVWGISNTSEIGSLTAHFAYVRTKITLASFDPLFDGFRQFGPRGVAIADENAVRDSPSTFVGVGASYDPGKWFTMAEWGRFSSDSVLGTRTAWYLSGGYRFGKFTPYLTYAKATADKLTDPGLNVSALPPFLAGPATALNAGLNTILSQKPVESTVSFGARWDISSNVDIKLQFDHMRVGDGSIGVLTNVQPGFPLGPEVNVFSATIDFVF
ncbi:MAG: porin [Pseudomonadota bacterium]